MYLDSAYQASADPYEPNPAPLQEVGLRRQVERLKYLRTADRIRAAIKNETGHQQSLRAIQRILDEPEPRRLEVGEPDDIDDLEFAPRSHSYTVQARMEAHRRSQVIRPRPNPFEKQPPVEPLDMDKLREASRRWPFSKKLAFEVCEELGADFSRIFGDARARELVHARALIAVLLREKDPIRYSNPAIGRIFGDRDHSSVIHWVREFGPVYCRRDDRLWPLYKALGGKQDAPAN